MCVGGPPNPMQPIRPHSRATVRSDATDSGFPAPGTVKAKRHLPVGTAR